MGLDETNPYKETAMFSIIQGHNGFVVDLTEEFPPEMPIHDGGRPELKPYAEALTNAIRDNIIKEPGKYLIEVYYMALGQPGYNVYRINE